MGTAGASESKKLDAQAGIECAIQVLMSALSGASLVHDVGFLDCADIGSLGMLVMSDEVIAMTRRILRGIQVNQDTIMLDLLEQVGPGGQFLTERRSVSLCRSEIWAPSLSDRNQYTIWEQNGSATMEQRVEARVRKLLSTHTPAPFAGWRGGANSRSSGACRGQSL